MEVEIKDHTAEAVDAKDQAIERALEIIGMKLEKYAKFRCPTGTPESTGIPGYIGGTLKNSITYATAKHAGKTIKVEAGQAKPTADMHGGKAEAVPVDEEECVYLGTNVFYAPYVELGTSRGMSPRPFLKPALQDHLSEYEHVLSNELKKALG